MEKGSTKRIKLKQFRVSLDLSQEQLADALGMSRAHYAMIENGQRYGTLKFWRKLQTQYNLPKADVYDMMTEIEF